MFQEGRRRYLGSFSSYSRYFFGRLHKPDVEQIEGISPTLAVDQRSICRNSRSNVATLTDISNYFRVLLARFGKVKCYKCGSIHENSGIHSVSRIIYKKFLNEKICIYAPLVSGHKGEYIHLFEKYVSKGFRQFRIDGELFNCIDIPVLQKNKRHSIDVFISELNVKKSNFSSLEKVVSDAMDKGTGTVIIVSQDSEDIFSTNHVCQKCGTGFPEIGPRLFSFNSTYGACPDCNGLGENAMISPDLLITDPTKSIREGAFITTTPTGYIVYSQVTIDVLDQVCRAHGFNVDIPWKELSKENRDIIYYGSEKLKVPFGKHTLESRMKWSGITAKPREEGYYPGIITIMSDILKRDRNKNILRFAKLKTCESCHGARLKKESLSVFFFEKNMAQLCSLNVGEALEFFDSCNMERHFAAKIIIDELRRKLRLLNDLGLSYLELDRSANTLSRGEGQRLRLVNQVGNGLSGITYVFDEPSAGLHSSENSMILKLMTEIKDGNNTVLVVDHERDILRGADRIVELGPKAGVDGGKIIFDGSVKDWEKSDGYTRNFETDFLKILQQRSCRESPGIMRITGARQHNLKNIDVDFKLGMLNVVCGVSGSGKSTLIDKTLGKALQKKLNGALIESGKYDTLDTGDKVKRIVIIDQSPIGRNSRSNPATYTELFSYIRGLFSKQEEALKRGWKKNRFSFNVKGGRCEECQGAGVTEIGMHFFRNVETLCEKCGGKRFKSETLLVKYKNKDIFEVLEMTIDEAAFFFEGEKNISRILSSLVDVGLGYVQIGQSATTLSGGEAQRVKLADRLSKTEQGSTLYILDEPSTGLHTSDVRRLLLILDKLVNSGNTVIVVEHDLDVIGFSDWVIELGPEGGKRGGEVVFSGTAKELIYCENSITGRALREYYNHVEVKKEAVFVPKQKSEIVLLGGETNNLKKVDAVFPHNKITVVTGVSGSGKSSLVFDTLFSESFRKFSENLSAHSRRFIKKMKQADFMNLSGLTPGIAIQQRVGTANPRSTVGTYTEILDYYRLFFSRSSTLTCPDCNQEIKQKKCLKCGFVLEKKYSAGAFSYNNIDGACEQCRGMGFIFSCDPEKLITNPELSILNGALKGTKVGKFYGDLNGQYIATLIHVSEFLGIDYSVPWNDLSSSAKKIAMYGTGEKKYNVTWKFQRKKRTGEHCFETCWPGFVFHVDQEFIRKHRDSRGEVIKKTMLKLMCPKCNGKRYKKDLLNYRIAGLNISQLLELTAIETIAFFNTSENFTTNQNTVLEVFKGMLLNKLDALDKVGLGYLSLDRMLINLSAGELRRLKLASMAGTGITGVTFFLDEPTSGLHDHDTTRMIKVLKSICSGGNTVIVVEHDETVIRNADNIIDMGTGAGRQGGEIVACGTLAEIRKTPNSVTGRSLFNTKTVENRKQRKIDVENRIKINGAFRNNLDLLDIEIPVRGIIGFSGVSGSGKSSLLFGVIQPSFKYKKEVGCDSIEGLEQFERVIRIDQKSPVGSENSNLATYSGFFDRIRCLFSDTEYAKSLGYKKSYFSFNNKGGRCEECKGSGRLKIDMDFLPDVWSECEACSGKKFNRNVLGCQLNGLNIHDVLSLNVNEALSFFQDDKGLREKLEVLSALGLGYLKIGQPLSTFSGGEIQRLKIGKELVSIKKKNKNLKKNLYLIDEPTCGLHFKDIERLIRIFDDIADEGHTLFIIEHNLDILMQADWIVDLGPGGGPMGGKIVDEGHYSVLTKNNKSKTGIALLKKMEYCQNPLD